MKNTKIIATIGLASCNLETLQGLAKAGVNIARFNFSHAQYEANTQWMNLIRDNKLPLALMLDTKGPEIRTGEVKGALEVKTGDKITLTTDIGIYEDTGKISVNYKEFLSDCKVGTIMSFDSGAFFVKAIEKKDNDVIGEVIKGSGKITTKRHINFTTGEDTTQPTLGEKDWKDIDYCIKEKMDFIALSFTRRASDVMELREYCQKKGHIPSIISKIENQAGVDNIEEIIQASDGIMIARGDLSEEIPYYKVPQIERDIIELCNYYAKPVVVATQMIMSMCENIRPTRAEVNDVATAVLLGADCTMTSDETAKGKYPVNAIECMAEIVKNNEPQLDNEEKLSNEELHFSLIRNAVETLNNANGIDAVVVISKSGKIVNHISNAKLAQPIFAYTDSSLATNKLKALYGVQPNTISFDNDYEKTIQTAFSETKKQDNNIKNVLLVSYYKVGNNEYPLISIRDI